MKKEQIKFIQKHATFTDLSSTTLRKIDATLIYIAYKQAYFGMFVSLFCATVLFFGLYTTVPLRDLIIWYAFGLIVTVSRTILIYVYAKQEFPEQRTTLWQNLFIVGALLGGLIWGLAGSYLLPNNHSFQQTLIILVISGVTAGAVPNLAAIRNAPLAFLFASLIPLIYKIIIGNTGLNLLFVLTLIAYFIYMIILAIRIYATTRNAVCLQFENDALLINLSKTKKQLEFFNKQLEQAATHDPLTHLANRNLFIENFAKALNNAEKNKKMLALLYLDLDSFKSVNDFHGHQMGDQLLLAVVSTLELICKNSDIISRLGGDEFTIILENVASLQEIEKVAKEICETLAKPIQIGAVEVIVSVSIGVSIYPVDSTDAEELLNMADHAMYYVKGKGGNNYRFQVEMTT